MEKLYLKDIKKWFSIQQVESLTKIFVQDGDEVQKGSSILNLDDINSLI